ncbi:MAG: WYL domain-containing protein [Actinomycetota bacterium]|nr:MAG: WYL domain-containing protein [Actinomycetota bacterium]
MAQADKFPRLFNLVMLLLDTTKPISLDEIARRIGGFPDSQSARHQAFERAKKELRELGIPIATHQIPGEEQYGYQIKKSEMIIPDLRFTEQEASSLAAASALVSFGSGERESALQKLGCVIAGHDAVVANIPSQPALFRLFEAIGLRRMVQFSYRSKVRSIDIYGISFKWGNWYLLGHERESGQLKTFLLNRIESEVTVTQDRSPERPKDFDVSSSLPKNRWEVGQGDLRTAAVLFYSDVAPLAEFEFGKDSIAEFRSDGSIVMSVPVVDSGSFLDWLLSYFDKAKLLGPPSLVEELKQYLNRLVDESFHVAANKALVLFESADWHDFESHVDQSAGDFVPQTGNASKEAEASLRSATAMYSVLVKILPWLAAKKSTTVDEISKTFSVSGPDVVRMLEIAACCGLPPYTPDSLLEIIVEDDGTVNSYLDMAAITAPRTLNTLEAMVLATTASAALKVPGMDRNGELAAALAKLQTSLAKFQIGLSEVDVKIEEPYFLEMLRSAAIEHFAVEMTYFAASSERISKRRVDPYQLFTESGKWYLRGFCHLTDEIRHFSVGRVISCELLNESFELPEAEMQRISRGGIPKAFGGRGDWVVLAIASDNGWMVERLVSSPRLLVTEEHLNLYGFHSSSSAWLSKLLIRLDPSAFVVFPAAFRGLKQESVQRLAASYA